MQGAAPITETLAAALILLTPWKPDRILVADSGFRTYGKEYNGVPTVALGYDGVRIRYVR